MDEFSALARGAIAEDEDWERALQKALEQVCDITADVAFLFASEAYAEHFSEMVRRVRRETGAAALVGCSGQGIIGSAQELEGVPALSLLTLALPGAKLHAVHFTQEMIEDCASPHTWHEQLGITPDEVNAWLIFADPFQMDTERLIDGLAEAYPGRPMLGGLASGDTAERRTFIFLNDDVFDEGGVGLAIGGAYTILPLVSQGCEPIGEPWTITKVRGNLIETISNRPAYDLLIETLQGLPAEMQRRARYNLLVGLAADEYRDSFPRGSFLIRPLVGVEREKRGLAIGAFPKVGQTIQFQLRDAAAADRDLIELLEEARASLSANKPVAGVLCSCNGRGIGMFGTHDHDAGAVARQLGQLPLAGLFCNGEIGPIGMRPFLHGFTASLALVVRKGVAATDPSR
jgi:small ligand-binding sensory domain FIST